MFRAVPLAQEQVYLLLTPTSGVSVAPCSASNRLSMALTPTHLVGMHRLRKALHLDGAQIVALEEIPEQPPRLRPDHDRAGFGKTLQGGASSASRPRPRAPALRRR